MAYAFLEPTLTARLGWWQGGLVFGAVLPVLVLWFVVMPLKGLPIGGGFALSSVLQHIVLNAVAERRGFSRPPTSRVRGRSAHQRPLMKRRSPKDLRRSGVANAAHQRGRFHC
jgi:hypothetical protein